jgi:glycine betaine/proline transport system ATP-binding protein
MQKKDTTNASKCVIECRNVWKIFGNRSKEALKAIQENGLSKEEVRDKFDCVVGVKDASFSVYEGEIFCIMGLSGSGKSTLIRHINRLIEPTHGDIIIDGQNIGDLNNKDLRAIRSSKMGMVFQAMALLPHKTVLENVALPLELRGESRSEREKTALEALKIVDLAGWETKYPDELSGGMQQRVGLARAMAADPPILLMDEPFSALDPLIRRQLQDEFMTLATDMKKTTLFITHDLDEAIRIGDRIAIMKDGELVQIGTPEEIVTAPADDYVADFVSGISKLGLITAQSVMEPFDRYMKKSKTTGDIDEWPTAEPEDNLDALVDLAIDTNHPIVVAINNKPVGVVTKKGSSARYSGSC